MESAHLWCGIKRPWRKLLQSHLRSPLKDFNWVTTVPEITCLVIQKCWFLNILLLNDIFSRFLWGRRGVNFDPRFFFPQSFQDRSKLQLQKSTNLALQGHDLKEKKYKWKIEKTMWLFKTEAAMATISWLSVLNMSQTPVYSYNSLCECHLFHKPTLPSKRGHLSNSMCTLSFPKAVIWFLKMSFYWKVSGWSGSFPAVAAFK